MDKLFMIGLIGGLFLIVGCTEKVAGPAYPACTREYMPVCGVDGVTYANRCTAGDVAIASEGECGQTSTFCIENGGTLETKEDGSRYCTLNGQECEEGALYRGECSTIHFCTAEEKAGEMCTLEYMPVCGNDGETYGNRCAACVGQVDFWTSGECPE